MSPRFWSRLRVLLITLIIIFVIGAIVCYFTLEGWSQLFYVSCSLILAVNVGIAYLFVRLNDGKRPDEKRRSDHHSDRI